MKLVWLLFTTLLLAAAANYTPCFTIDRTVLSPSQTVVLSLTRPPWIFGEKTDLVWAFGDELVNVTSSLPDDCPVVESRYIHCKPNKVISGFTFTATLDPAWHSRGDMIRSETHVTVSGVVGDATEWGMYNYDQILFIVDDTNASILELASEETRQGFFADGVLAPSEWTWLSANVVNYGPDIATGVVLRAEGDPTLLVFQEASGSGGLNCTVTANATVECGSDSLGVGVTGSVAIMLAVVPTTLESNVTARVAMSVSAANGIDSWIPRSQVPAIRLVVARPPESQSVELFPVVPSAYRGTDQPIPLAIGQSLVIQYGPRLPLCFDGEDYDTSVGATGVLETSDGMRIGPEGGWVATPSGAKKELGTLKGEAVCSLEVPATVIADSDSRPLWAHVTASALSDNNEFTSYSPRLTTTFIVVDRSDLAALRMSTPPQPWNLGDKPVFMYKLTACNDGPGPALRANATIDMHEFSSGSLELVEDLPEQCRKTGDLAVACKFASLGAGDCADVIVGFKVTGSGTFFAAARQEVAAENAGLVLTGPVVFPMIFKAST